jgi:hypothetical protein
MYVMAMYRSSGCARWEQTGQSWRPQDTEVAMIDGINVRVLGDYGPFSRMGKSIGYQVTIGESSFLVDCGAPLFQQIGGHGLKNVKGVIITHCHDDHKRWFSDLALFNMYAPDVPHLVALLTSEEINEGLARGSAPALETSLSEDSLRVIDIAYDEYIEFLPIGPRARYRIVQKNQGGGSCQYVVVDRQDAPVGPERAKIVISDKTGKPRLLFRDPPSGEWVEPVSFYPFSAEAFYEKERNIYRDPQGFTIEAINAPVWHGVPGIGLKFSAAGESLVFSADTNHDLELWEQLYTERRPRRGNLTDEEFAAATVIHGDINDYIERTWSEARYREAVAAFRDTVVIHDIATRKSVVHTDYRRLDHTVLEKELTILTHSPDKMTSEWVLSRGDKTFRIKGKEFFEMVDDAPAQFTADIYHKEDGHYFVGYRNPAGEIGVHDDDGILRLSTDPHRGEGKLLYRVDLYEDIGGRYFPRLDDELAFYRLRPDGKVELVETSPTGSLGRIVEDQRARLFKGI